MSTSDAVDPHGGRGQPNPRPRAGVLAILVIAVVIGLAFRTVWEQRRTTQVVRERLIMGTTCRLIAVGRRDIADQALDRAWQEIESVNATMSTYNPDSELSRFNAAEATTDFPLSPRTLAVLRLSQTAVRETQGTFDVTVLPLIRLWQASVRAGREPTPAELKSALQKLGTQHLVLSESSCRKQLQGMQVTLDGIAPGYAVQQAILALQTAGLSGGLIDLGGDIACFGKPGNAEAWRVAIQNPWSDGSLGVLPLSPAPGKIQAVSTSGDYRRYLQIGTQRYSHILDPRTGRPATQATSVTVIAEDAIAADIWATALSVLGPAAGTALCEKHPTLAALFISGTQLQPNYTTTQRFPSLPLRGAAADQKSSR